MSRSVMQALGEVASQRWGLVTTAEAARAGVGRMTLSRLAQSGAVERVQRGVYRMAGAPEVELEHTYATWLALGGGDFTPGQLPPVVAVGQTAAIAHRLGNFYPQSEEFMVPARRGTRLPGVRLRVGTVDAQDVTFADGLAVLTAEATIADLVAQWTDLSLVAHVVADADDRHKIVNLPRLIELLGPLAVANGLNAGDGQGLWSLLAQLAGIESDVSE